MSTATHRAGGTRRVASGSGASAAMAAGTVVSRASGFVRSALLASALGLKLHADIFNVANTIPNTLYILLAGGVFNAVLVPQLVRSMRNDADGGEAYANRVITLAALFLASVTVILVVAAPAVMSLFLSGCYDLPSYVARRASVIAFARFCLPQVFFYGMFVLVGQILNARGRFGPMMWAPIANNVISVAVLLTYLATYGSVSGAGQFAAFSPGQERLLGLGSTAGIVAQLLILVPYLRSAGFRVRPRLDFRGSGLGHTLSLGTWTLLFVVVNQIAYAVVVNLASTGTACGGRSGTGYTVYSYAFLIVMVPHSIITVSLATAMLPSLSASGASGNLTAFVRDFSSTLRTALAVIVPFVALLPLIAHDLTQVINGHGAARTSYASIAPTLALFGAGLFFFTFHYLVLRGFYALEATRQVFWIQCVVAATNITVAIVLVGHTSPSFTAPALVIAYTASYAVGSVLSYRLLSGRLNGLDSRRLVRFLARLLVVVAISTAVAAVPDVALRHVGGGSWPVAAVRTLVVTGVDVGLVLVLARLLRVGEVGTAVRTFAGPLLRRL